MAGVNMEHTITIESVDGLVQMLRSLMQNDVQSTERYVSVCCILVTQITLTLKA